MKKKPKRRKRYLTPPELGRLRWAGKTDAEKKAHARMMLEVRLRKMRERAAAGAAA